MKNIKSVIVRNVTIKIAYTAMHLDEYLALMAV